MLLLALVLVGVHAWSGDLARSPRDHGNLTASGHAAYQGLRSRVFRALLGATSAEASTPAHLARAFTSPWVHGDLVHLGINLLGILLLGGLLERRRGGTRTLVLFCLGAYTGTLAATLAGTPTLGASGGVYALAGGIFVCGENWWVRSYGILWMILGALGGSGDPLIDQRAHVLGAVLGLIAARSLPGGESRAGRMLLGTVLVLGFFGLAQAPVRAARAQLAIQRVAPDLRLIVRTGRVIENEVRHQAKIRRLLDDLFAAASAEEPVAQMSSDILMAILGGPSPRLSIDPLEDGEKSGSRADLWRGPPEMSDLFLDAVGRQYRPVPEQVDEAHRKQWKALLDSLSEKDQHIEHLATELARRSEEFYGSLLLGPPPRP